MLKILKSWQSWYISTISMTILRQLDLNSKVLILKILTETKNNMVLTVSFKSWSWQIKKSGSQSRLVSTIETSKLTIKTNFDQDQDFLRPRDIETSFLKRSRFSLLLRSTFETYCRDHIIFCLKTSFLKRSRFSILLRPTFWTVEIESLNQDHINKNLKLKLSKYLQKGQFWWAAKEEEILRSFL
jgi:hypothetical protein